jgi:hypothetical protein
MAKKAKDRNLPDGPVRKVLDGSLRPEVSKDTVCQVETKCPGKWAFVDMESGNIWMPTGGDLGSRFKQPTESDLKCISRAVWQYNREWDGQKWVKKKT